MKIFRTLFLVIFGVLVLFKPILAHKEWTHQYILKEAYHYLLHQLKLKYGPNFFIPELEEHIALWKQNGVYGKAKTNGLHRPWDDAPALSIGIFEEDIHDAIWEYSRDEIFEPNISSTHFWQPDSYDENQLQLIGYGVQKQFYENAWEKSRIYHYGITLPAGCGRILHRGPGYLTLLGKYGGDFLGGDVSKRISYINLIDIYKNGNYWYYGGEKSGFLGFRVGIRVNPPQYNPDSKPLNNILRKTYAYQILGRIAHLLQDMSVPAHAHSDTHACNWPIADGDSFENWAGRNFYTDPGACSDINSNPRATEYATYLTAATQGGFLLSEEILLAARNIEDDYKVLRFLFYTTAQIAQFFPAYRMESLTSQGALQQVGNKLLGVLGCNSPELGGLILNENDYVQKEIDKILAFLQAKYPDPDKQHPDYWQNHLVLEDVGHFTLNYAIRATATLLYWFVLRAGVPTALKPYAVTVDGESSLGSGRCATYTAYRSGEGSGLPATIQWQMRREINGELPGNWQDIGTGPTASVCMDGNSDKIRVRARSTIISTGVTATGTFLVENYTIKREGRPVVLAADVSKSVSITTPKLGSSITNLARKYQNDLKPTTDSTVFYYTNTFGYTLPATSKVTIEVLNNQYRKVASWNEIIEKPAMQYTHTWNASTMPEGAYLVRIVAVEAQTGIYHRSYLPLYIKRTATPPWTED